VLGRPFRGGSVRQPGGTIEVRWDSAERVLEMTGTARLLATGTVALDRAQRPLAGVPVS